MSFSIIGTGRCVPEYILSNEELSTMVETSDEWITKRTGVHERHICTDETLTDLCANAAKRAMESAGITADELDLIICATLRGDYITPAQACVVQKEIGASCPAFDINGACSGFIYALDVADGFFVRKKVKKVLVIAADNLSNITDWTDRTTCVLFGDGAGAVILSEGDGLRSIYTMAQGNPDVLNAPKGENTSPFYKHPSERSVLYMNGHEVYKFAVGAMVDGIKRAISDAGLQQSDIAYVVPHQANTRIIDTAASKLEIPADRYIYNIAHYGNTSASCMPMCLDEANKAGKFKKGDYIAMCAFGGGLTMGSAVIRWDI